MKFEYDIYNRTEPSKIYLARPGKELVCALNGVDEASVSLTLNLNNTHELSFEVYRYIDGRESAGYDRLERFMDLYVTGIGWFKIQHPETSFDGQKEVKHITAESLEIELQQYDLVGFKVNCGTEDSLEMMLDGNVSENEFGLKLPIKRISLYNPDNQKLSFLNLVLEDVPGWSVGYVDDYIDTSENKPKLFRDKEAKFDVDNQDIYSFLCQEAASAYNCIFIFDTENCTVNAYPPETIGKDTNLFIGFRNLQNNVEISVDADSIYTVFNVAGNDDLNINYVNFGSSRIEDLTYFLKTSYMSQTLIDKYTFWMDYLESKRPEYAEASKAYNAQLEIVTELKSRLPNDGCSTDWSSFADEELANAKNDYLAQKKRYEDLYVDENGAFDYEALKNSPDFTDYDLIVNIIIPNIEIEMSNRELVNSDDYAEYLDDWETDWKLFGLDELKAKLKGYQDTVTTLKKNGFHLPYSKDNSEYTENYHDRMHEEYQEAVQNYNDCLAAIGSEEDGQETGRLGELKAANTVLENHNQVRRNLEQAVSKDNELFGFTKLDLLILGKLYNTTDYVNNNILTTALNTSDEVVDIQMKLLEEAREQLSIESQPQFTYTTSQDNLFALPEYKDLHRQLELGSFIRISLRDDYEVKLRVISLSFNPLLLDNKLDITFSNMIMSNSKRNDFAAIVDRSSRSSKNQITIGSGSSDDGLNLSDSLLRSLLNSSGMHNMATDVVSDSVKAAVGAFSTLTADFMKVSELDAEIVKIGQLDTETAFAKYLSANFLTSDKFITKDMQSSTGTFTDWLTGVNIYAQNITGGTLSVERLEIRGSDKSIVYALNNITGALQSQNVDTLNGEVLTERTITGDRIVANSITAAELKTGTITAESGIISDLDAKVITAGELDAGKVNIKNLKADSIVSGTIDAEKINVINLNADNIITGNLSANIIEGGIFRGSEINLGKGNFIVDINGNSYQRNTIINGGLDISGKTSLGKWKGQTVPQINYSHILYTNNILFAVGTNDESDYPNYGTYFASYDLGKTWKSTCIISNNIYNSNDNSIPMCVIYDDNYHDFIIAGTNGIVTVVDSNILIFHTTYIINSDLCIKKICVGNNTYYIFGITSDGTYLIYETQDFVNNIIIYSSTTVVNDIEFSNNGLYMLVDNGKIKYYELNKGWIKEYQTNYSEAVFLVYGNGQFLLASKEKPIIYTKNFIEYDSPFLIGEEVNPGLPGYEIPSGNITNVIFSNSKFLIIRNNRYLYDVTYKSYSSPFTNSGIKSACYAEENFIIVGYNNKIISTSDLMFYEVIQKGTAPRINNIVYDNENFFALGYNGILLNIDTTGDWMLKSEYDTDLYDICRFKSDHLLAGNSAIYSFSRRYQTNIVANIEFICYSICNINDNKVIGVGEGGHIIEITQEISVYYSSKNITSPTNNTLYSLSYNSDIIVAVGEKGTIIKSNDEGLTWDIIDLSCNNTLRSCTYGKGNFVAVGNSGTILVMSIKSNKWTQHHVTIDNLYKVIFTNDRFMAVGENGTTVYSKNGIDWIRQTDEFNFNLISIASDGSTAIGVCDNCVICTQSLEAREVASQIKIDNGGIYYSASVSGNYYNFMYPDFTLDRQFSPRLIIPELEVYHLGNSTHCGLFFETGIKSPGEGDPNVIDNLYIKCNTHFSFETHLDSLYNGSDNTTDLLPRLNSLIVESGTFKPVVYGSTTAGNCTYTVTINNYYRIGKLVYINLRFTLTKRGTSAGGIYIKGLPYSCAVSSSLAVGDTAKQAGALQVHSASVSPNGYINIWRASLTNTATANNENATLQFSQVSDTFACHLSGCYLTNAGPKT